MKDGILVVNKPKGITSHDVVDYVRRQFHIKQVGHAGTLDPMATGVLIILIGRCTKLFDSFLGLD
ncbi:MAG: tRNA pseudouridine(55) synthase, partial [Candidatus Omnitrophica bacterium]|nr:tRNA pseudouridine(55) synthase [Candidatus Omnitrophota bacterium]